MQVWPHRWIYLSLTTDLGGLGLVREAQARLGVSMKVEYGRRIKSIEVQQSFTNVESKFLFGSLVFPL